MTDTPPSITLLPNPERDELIEQAERSLRKIEVLLPYAERIATARFRMFEAYRAAGFDDYDAREMSRDHLPMIL